MEQENLIFENTINSIRIVSKASNPIPHSHYEAEIIYCIKGIANITIEGVEYSLKKGCAIVIAPLTTYKNVIDNTEDENTELFVIRLNSKFLGSSYYEFASFTFESPFLSPENENMHNRYILKSIEKLYFEYTNKENGYNWMIHGLLCEIFALIVRYMPRKKRNTNGEHIFKNHIKILKVFDLVNKKYDKNLTI
ncbi:MAG: cupin domain-containing protein, partial [Clostridia bacterium]|nr:cupin domain-containing protein [Clostridia bacterium]